MKTENELEKLKAAYHAARDACCDARDDYCDDENKDNRIKNENKLEELQVVCDSTWIAYSNAIDACRGIIK